MSDSAATDLPPFSGDSAICVKCGGEGATTTYTSPGLRVDRYVASERLRRRCYRCDFEWDEAVADPAAGHTVIRLCILCGADCTNGWTSHGGGRYSCCPPCPTNWRVDTEQGVSR